MALQYGGELTAVDPCTMAGTACKGNVSYLVSLHDVQSGMNLSTRVWKRQSA